MDTLTPLSAAAVRPESASPARGLTGSLEQFALEDLLQTAELNRRSGTIVVQRGDRVGRLWLRDGRLAEASIDGGPRGEEAFYELVFWRQGTFEAEFRPVDVDSRIGEPLSALLLEAMRLHDERARHDPPPHAALVDPPPPPPPGLLAVHRGMMLVNVAAAYAADQMNRDLVARRLEALRTALLPSFPELAAYQVSGEALVTRRPGGELPAAERTVRALCRWLAALFEQLERALPGRFPLFKLRQVSEATQDDLLALGFYRELGLPTDRA